MSNENPGVGGTLPEPHLAGDSPHPAVPPPQHTGTPQNPGSPLHPGAPQQLPPPQHGVNPQQAPAPQHAGSAHQGPAPQHAGSAHQGPAPQHSGSPLDGPQSHGSDAVQHVSHQTPGSPKSAGGEHVSQNPAVDHAAQHAPSPHSGAAPQHAPGPGAGPAPAAAQHAGPHLHGAAGKGPWRQLKTLRHARPRLHMAIIGGSAAAAVAVGAIAVVAAQDDPPPQRAAVTSTVVPVSTTATAPVVVASTPSAQATAATAAPTTEAPATTEAPTTTVVALPSGAGEYSVVVGNLTVSGAGFSQSIPGNTQTWSFTGPCDGVGDCTISAAGEAVLSTGAVGSIFTGPGSQIGLVPAGTGSYRSTFDYPVAECGTGTGNMAITVDNGTLSGVYSFTLTETAACPLASVSATFTGTRI